MVGVRMRSEGTDYQGPSGAQGRHAHSRHGRQDAGDEPSKSAARSNAQTTHLGVTSAIVELGFELTSHRIGKSSFAHSSSRPTGSVVSSRARRLGCIVPSSARGGVRRVGPAERPTTLWSGRFPREPLRPRPSSLSRLRWRLCLHEVIQVASRTSTMNAPAGKKLIAAAIEPSNGTSKPLRRSEPEIAGIVSSELRRRSAALRRGRSSRGTSRLLRQIVYFGYYPHILTSSNTGVGG